MGLRFIGNNVHCLVSSIEILVVTLTMCICAHTEVKNMRFKDVGMIYKVATNNNR